MQLPARILLPLLLLFTVHFSRAQGITLSVENQALEKVMGSIEQQSGHRFVYSAEMMALSKPVTVNFRNETLNRALEIVFRDQPLTYTFNEKHIVLQVKKSKAAEDRRVLTGQVVDEKGEGLPGISVLIKGTRQGTMTDPLGQFRLEDVPASFRLLVSGVSIESREIAVSNTDFLKIETTPKLGELDQTVVIAYGTAKKRYLVESVSKVKGEDLSKQSVSNPILALGGRVAGLQIIQGSGVPGSNVTIRLRGRNSMVNGNDPLVVVDGVPFPTTPINTSFLPASISPSPLDFLNPADIQSIEILKDASATAIYGSRGANGVILITTKKASGTGAHISINTKTGIGQITRKMNFLNTEKFREMRSEAFKNDNSTPTNSNAPDIKLWDSTRYTDWQDRLIGNTMTFSDFNTTVSMGSQQTRFLVGTGYRRESTVFSGSFYSEKLSALTNMSHSSKDKNFELSISLNYMQNRSILPKDDLTSYVRTAPNAPDVYTPDGKLNWANSSWVNPWTSILQYTIGSNQTWQANTSLSYHILPTIEFRINGGFTSITNNDSYRTPIAALNPSTNPQSKSGWNKAEVRIKILEPQLTYHKTFGSKNNLNMLAGASIQASETNGVFLQGTGYANDDLLGSITSANTITVSNETSIKYRYIAGFGRIQYDYGKKYLVTLNARRDGSSRYGPDSRFSNFYSIGAGWIWTSESWMSNLKWINSGKLRISLGTTGNDQIGDYKFLDLYGPGSVQYMGGVTYRPLQLFNPGYNWEKVKKSEVGIDVALFSSRVILTANYFYNKTSNQLVNYTLPITTGFSGILKNIPAVITNKGLEIESSIEVIKRRNFNWNLNLNVTFPRNELVSFKDFETSTYASLYVIGQPLNVVKVFESKGVDPTSGLYAFTDFDKDGRISAPNDQKKTISTVVEFFGGIENTFSYKRLMLSFHFGFSRQPNARNYLYLSQKPGSIENQPEWVLKRWQNPGDVTDIQRFTSTASAPSTAYSNYRQSDAVYSDASFIRLRNLQLAYRGGWYKVFVSGQNLFVVTRFKGLDPETLNLLPPIRTLSAGIDFNF